LGRWNVGLEDWDFGTSEGHEIRYNLIWNEWCLGYLTDQQLVEYLKACRDHLANDGWTVVKENVNVTGDDVLGLDSSVAR
jgi:protein N-terminal methyltransferase